MRAVALLICLVVALGGTAVAGAQTPQCDAGKELLEAGQVADAKQRFNKALDEAGDSQPCGIAGLKAVADVEKQAAADEKELTFEDAWNDAWGFVKQTYPWIVVVIVVWALMLFVAWFRDDGDVRVRAPASSEDLAKRVAAAARAAWDEGTPPAKIITASDETADTTAADLAKAFRIPGTVPIGDLLKRPPFSGWLSTRLDVSGAIAGSRALIDLTLRKRLSSTKLSQRIAVDLGDADEAEKTEVLALIGGAWLNAALPAGERGPVAHGDADGLTAHALFRAGADRHALGKTQIARACYAAMPPADPHDAPQAWVGSRLNEMMALKTEHRWLEAAQLANQVGDFPNGILDGGERSYFDEALLAELLLRQRYMTAIARVDHWYAVTQKPNLFSPDLAQLRHAADVAVERLEALLDSPAGASRRLDPLRAAGRMVVLSYRIASGEEPDIDAVRERLGVGGFGDARRPAVTAAGYYDAACAVSLLMERACNDDVERCKRYAQEGLWLLETAVAATPEARRPRVRELAHTDPMLDHLERIDPAGFAAALGEPPPPEEQAPPKLREAIAGVLAAFSRG